MKGTPVSIWYLASETYYESCVVENLVPSATEKVRRALILERVVDRASNIFPVAERQRVLWIDAVPTTVPVVQPTWTRTDVSCTSLC